MEPAGLKSQPPDARRDLLVVYRYAPDLAILWLFHANADYLSLADCFEATRQWTV